MPPTPPSSTSSTPTDPLPLTLVALPVLLPTHDFPKDLFQIPDMWITYWYVKGTGWVTTTNTSEKAALRTCEDERYAQVLHIPGRPYAPPTPPPAVPPAPDLQPVPPP